MTERTGPSANDAPDAAREVGPGAFLRQAHARRFEVVRQHWGFGGLHGGLALGLMTAAMQAEALGTRLRSVSARFHRPIVTAFDLEVSDVSSGRTLTRARSSASSAKGLHVEAAALFSPDVATPQDGRAWPVVTPLAPPAPPPEACEVFAVPSEFVPISVWMEIRPVGPNRPYAGGAEPALTAWVRLLEDDEPPDVPRLILLMDALAPSYAALLPSPQFVPTLELSVCPSRAVAAASSPWVLLHAQTRTASTDGWVEEAIDAWGREGQHLGSARQLRIVRS